MSVRLFEELMKFCPRCGKRLTNQDEPAECDSCGWNEEEAEDDD